MPTRSSALLALGADAPDACPADAAAVVGPTGVAVAELTALGVVAVVMVLLLNEDVQPDVS
jgi:hypothetical protein